MMGHIPPPTPLAKRIISEDVKSPLWKTFIPMLVVLSILVIVGGGTAYILLAAILL